MKKENVDKKTVLIVEDEEALSQAIGKKLELSGFDVVKARSVEEALGKIDVCGKVDAVWLDHYLLGKDTGFDFVVKLKEDDECKDIPIFVVSNTASLDKVNAYLELGVNEYYAKSNNRLEDIIADIKKET